MHACPRHFSTGASRYTFFFTNKKSSDVKPRRVSVPDHATSGKIYGVSIDIADDTLKDEQYTGVFRLDLPVEEVLKIINYQNQFTYKAVEDRIVILPKKNQLILTPKPLSPMEK
ncbi:MAG: DUF4974 domain-containing protein [Tannerella sp.]|nr:DUF4974 domain-containing protein [Tannerella sp.]